MNNRLTRFAIAGFTILALALPSMALAKDQNKIVEPAPQLKQSQPAGFSAAMASPALTPLDSLPAVYEMDESLAEEGSYFGWIDENGQRLELTRENEDIIIRGEGRATARLRITDMDGMIEPRLVKPALLVAESR